MSSATITTSARLMNCTPQTEEQAMVRKVSVSSFLGNFIEWFDYASYSYFATTIALVFFPTDNHTVAMLQTFGVFALSFLMRPVGAFFWGHMGDKKGRKWALATSILMMSAATFVIGLLCNISSATRCSLITGANNTRHRVTNWTLEKNKATDRPSNTIELPDWNYNGVSQVTGTPNTFVGTSFVELLRQNGYHTIHCGKAHFGSIDTPGENPSHWGFEVNIAGHAAGGLATYLSEQTIIFAPSIEEGKNVTALLNSQHGASTAAFIDGTTQNRGRLLEAYRLGLIKVLVCYAVLTEGVDLPMTETVLLARPVATTNVGLYAQMVGRGLRLHPGKSACKIIDCVGISRMPICTAATLIGEEPLAPKPKKEQVEKLPEETEPIKVLTGADIPDTWIQNQKEVDIMALGEGVTTHDVAWITLKDGGYILPIPTVTYRISKPLTNGMVYLRKNKACSKSAVPLQFALDYVYQDLKQKHAKYQHIWDKKQRYKWDRQPITNEQIALIHKLAPDYKIDTHKMTRGDASRAIQLLTYKPEEWTPQTTPSEVQDDAKKSP